MPPPTTKPTVNVVKKREDEETPSNPNTPSTPSKAATAFSRIRTLSVATGSRKRAPSTSSKHSLLHADPNTNFLTFDLTAERALPAIDEKKLNSLQKAVFDNDIKKCKKLLSEEKRDVDKLDSVHGITALYLSVMRDKLDIALFLLGATDKSIKKVDPNVACFKGRTALMMVSYFISSDVEKVNPAHPTALTGRH